MVPRNTRKQDLVVPRNMVVPRNIIKQDPVVPRNIMVPGTPGTRIWLFPGTVLVREQDLVVPGNSIKRESRIRLFPGTD